MHKKLIVNADDLGLSKKTNDGIMESYLNGIVTSSTLMMTMDAVEHALLNVRGTNLDVGLHIDLTWGTATAPAGEIRTLVEDNGRFIGKKNLIKKLLLNKIKESDLVAEITTQINKFRGTGLELFHIDVHQHFHGFPVVMRALMKVALAESIPFVRFVSEISLAKPVNTFIYLMFKFSSRHFAQSIGKTDNFMGLSLTDNLNEESLAPQLAKIKPGLSELMCHPGYDDPTLNSFSRLQSREDEIRALTSNKVKDIIAGKGINLTTFRDESRSLR